MVFQGLVDIESSDYAKTRLGVGERGAITCTQQMGFSRIEHIETLNVDMLDL